MTFFPVRAEVGWEESGPEQVVIIINKELSSLEERVANFLGAPKSVRRPMDEMNSKPWMLMDGKMTVNQLVAELDRIFAEKIAPAPERVNRSIADFVKMGLVKLHKTGFDEQE